MVAHPMFLHLRTVAAVYTGLDTQLGSAACVVVAAGALLEEGVFGLGLGVGKSRGGSGEEKGEECELHVGLRGVSGGYGEVGEGGRNTELRFWYIFEGLSGCCRCWRC
jgi:hypothetical protein